jgi:hypothetical protein
MAPGGYDCLAERGGCSQHAGVVRKQGVGALPLLGSEVAVEGHGQRLAILALVSDDCPNAEVVEERQRFIDTAARQTDVPRVILGACDDTRLAIRGEPHGLRLVELGILERGEPQQLIPQRRIQISLLDVGLVAQHELECVR